MSDFPVPGGDRTKCWVLLYEAVGTCILIGALNISQGNAASLGTALFAIAIFLGPVCGGHVNPAVTIAVWINKGDKGANFVYMLMIIAAQLCGAGVGVTLAGLTNRSEVITIPSL